MKKIFCLAISLLFFVSVFAQVTKSIPKKVETKLDVVLKILEESKGTITENQIVSLFDSLDQEEVKKLYKKENPYKIDKNGDIIYSVGDKAHGGIVFWVDKSGRHGLVAFEEDQATEVFPYFEGEKYKGETSALKGDSIYAGKFNTEQIIANKSVGYDAAKICVNFRGGGYNDWYLPSKFELKLLYMQYRKNVVGNFARDYYWSSSEDINDVAWLFRFYDGQLYNYPRYGSTAFRIRAIRAF